MNWSPPTRRLEFSKHTPSSSRPSPVRFRVSYPFINVTLSAKKPRNAAYPDALVSIGDHIRSRRLDLGLRQKEVACQIGVGALTITNWELNYTKPEVQYLPKIIDFLGYVPFSVGESFPEKLKAYRMLHGLTQFELSQVLRVDPTTVRLWEAGTQKPMQRMRERVLGVMAEET